MASSAVGHVLSRRDSVSLTYIKEWSIGIYSGESPWKIASAPDIHNPVLTARDVADTPASGVADPFMIQRDGKWYMFFEVIPKGKGRGAIGLATSLDGLNWRYEQIVLSEPFHLSYPCVFEWDGAIYMVPETSWRDSVRLYRAESFPTGWAFQKTLLALKNVADATPLYYDDTWWLFTSVASHDCLRLFYSNELMGPWREHPRSPLVEGSRRTARPGGRPLLVDGRLFRLAQDTYPTYGSALRAFEVLEVSTTGYRERERCLPLLRGTGKGWNRGGMHHADFHRLRDGRWVGAVDGFARRLALELHF
jgi:hypothetical protein